MSKIKSLFYIGLFFIITTVFISCVVKVHTGSFSEIKYQCIKEIDNFHQEFNNKSFDEIYNNASVEFQKSANKDTILAHMNLDYKKFGKFKFIIDSTSNVILGAPIQVRSVIVSKYEKTDITELFTFTIIDNNYKLILYSPSKGRVNLTKLKNVSNNN